MTALNHPLKTLGFPVTSLRKLAQASLPLVFLSGMAGCTQDTGNRQPNVVIIFIDDMGYGDLSCYGNTQVQTPNLDAFAAKGIKFTNFYVNSPICSPSRVALTTGQYPMRHRIHSYIASSQQNKDRAMADFLDPAVPTLARTLQQSGYATGHFGKWHMGGGRDLGDVPYPGDYGYDQSLTSFEGIGDRVLFKGEALSEMSAKLGRGRIFWIDKHQSTGIYVDSALSFISRHKDGPFFVNLCPDDVHDPHKPDSARVAKYKDITDNPYEQNFFAVLEEMDRQLGRFFKGLEDMGVMENTMVLIASDNGPTDWPYYYNRKRYPEDYGGELYPPGSTGGFYGRKWSLYEGGIRMPLIVRWDRSAPAGKTDSVTVMAAMDVFPSVCSLLGIDYPDNLDGTDKGAALLGRPVVESPAVMWEYGSNPGGSILPGNKDFISPSLAMRDDDWKLLMNADSSQVKLFNLKDDPHEVMNLAETESQRVKTMAAALLAWRKSMPVAIAE